MSILNSSIFYFYWRVHGDGFHCGYKDIGRFQVCMQEIGSKNLEKLSDLAICLSGDLNANSEIRHRNQQRTGRIELQTFFVGRSIQIINEIDFVLGDCFGLTGDEIDYLVNYDIKYRMGRERSEVDV